MADPGPMNRRQFVGGALAVMACGGLASCAGPGAGELVFITGPVDVGTLAAYPVDGSYDRFAKSNGFFILRAQGKLVAASVICTHRRCVVEKDDSELVCPCHGSRFNATGTPVEGPAKRPLPRFAITREPQGRLIVDPSRAFNETQWNDPVAFVKLDP